MTRIGILMGGTDGGRWLVNDLKKGVERSFRLASIDFEYLGTSAMGPPKDIAELTILVRSLKEVGLSAYRKAEKLVFEVLHYATQQSWVSMRRVAVELQQWFEASLGTVLAAAETRSIRAKLSRETFPPSV